MGRHLLAAAFVSLFCLGVVLQPSSVYAEESQHATETHDEHNSKPSLPMDIKGDLALWSLVTFFVFFFVLQKMAWTPLSTELTNRENKITSDIAAAENQRLKAESLLKDYETKLAKAQEEVSALLAEARRDAEHTKQEIVATANREADASRQRAIAEIEQAKNTALTELFETTFANVVNLTERVLQKGLTSDDQERLVRQAMSELSARRN